MADLQREIDALDRVLFRLASVDDARLVVVLDALLPQLLALFPAATATPLEHALKDKILQVVSHVKTRLHGISGPRLPLLALAALLDDDDAATRSPFAINFAFLFIEMGFAAATSEEQASVLSRLATSLAQRGAALQETFFRLLLSTFPATTSDAPQILADASTAAGDVVLDFLLDVVVYQPTAADAPVFGLMTPRLERLQRVKVTDFSREKLYDCQLHALQFVKNLGHAHPTRVLHLVAGVSSFHHVVKSFSEDQLHRVLNEDVAALENAALCRDIMALIMSSQVVAQGRPLQGRDALLLGNRTRVADASILAAVNLLKASKVAASVLPLMLQVICQLMYADEVSRVPVMKQRIKIVGAQLCEWSFHHCPDQFLAQLLGPVLLPTLLRTLMDPNADLDTSQESFWREFRQHIYESVSVLTSRAPSLVTATEQAFQVLLVRCLVEEKTRSGVNALKAMNSLRGAFRKCEDPTVLSKIQSELTGLLQGTKLYETSSNYQRIRVVVAEWVETIAARSALHGSAATSTRGDGNDARLRFALFKLCGDDDEAVRRSAEKALYAKPFPSVKCLTRTIRSLLRTDASHCLQRVMSVREAQQCLLFLQIVMKEHRDDLDEENDEQARQEVVKYFVGTLLEKPIDPPSSKRDVTSLCGSVARQLIELHEDFPQHVDALVQGRAGDLIAAMARAGCSSRNVLIDLATLLQWSLASTIRASGDLVQLMNAAKATIESPSAPTNDVCTALYTLGAWVAVFSKAKSTAVLTEQHKTQLQPVLSCLCVTLQAAVSSVSNFGSLPRGDEALNNLFDRLRSCIDAVGCSGNWNALLEDGQSPSSESMKQLRGDMMEELRKVVAWKLDGVLADGSLKSKLTSVRMVALDAITNTSSASIWPRLDEFKFEEVLSVILDLGSIQQPELQFSVAHTLIAIGSSLTKDNDIHYSSQLVERIMRDCAGARQVPMRRSATIWLLCASAAGLGSSTLEVWTKTFHEVQFATTIVSIHEFFVTMLNDTDPVIIECAVKGLAYLRLRAPTAAIGDKFSDSLFRRLRCFRAFAPASSLSPAGNARREDGDDDDESMATALPPPSANSNQTEPSSSTGGDTVENVAYREVSNVAADIGDPELMYSLLYLSTTNPIWEALAANLGTSFRAAFSFPAIDRSFRTGIIEQASQQWMSEAFEHRKKLIPWLFLLKNHSNTKVAEVMNNLWNFAKGELVVSASQEKSLLAQQWDTILDFLLTKLENSRNFKYREACCLALVDLLNGAGAAEVEPSFVRLWKITSRSVDDIMEAVAVAGLKLFKALGELSLRIAVKHEGCRRELLDYLVSQGMATKNVVCRALCIDLLLRLVKEVDATSLEDRLGALILKLLEYLSSLEMPELQYAQFHVGDKKDQLERLRVSMSQSGPVGQLLDQCMLKLKALATSNDACCVRIVDEISRGLLNLLKFGVGLNTRVGSANFTATLATELPFELRKCGGAELIVSRALLPYVADRSASENDHYGDEEARYESTTGLSDGLVLQSYLRAAGYLCALAEPSTVKNFVQSGVFAVHRRDRAELAAATRDGKSHAEGFADSDTYTSRYLMVSALATRELATKCPPITDASTMVAPDSRNEWYTTDVFPAAFIGQYASSEALRTVWSAVLEELPPRIMNAESALDATLSVLARWIRHPSWDTRRQGIKALQALFFKGSSYRLKLTPHQTNQIWSELFSAVPGRLWRGKGVILEALVAIASVRIDESQSLLTLLLQEADRAWKNNEMEYLESALVSLGCLAAAMPSTEPVQMLRLQVITDLRSRLEVWRTTSTVNTNVLAPMMVKVVFETLGSVIPPSISMEEGSVITRELLQWLDTCLSDAAFHVWSVRRSVFSTIATVVRSAPVTVFTSQHILNRLVDRSCGDLGVGDGKYSMIRVAAGDVLVALASRHMEPAIAMQLTAHRERLSAAVDVLRGSDEPNEQQVAAQIFTQLANSVAA